MENVNKFPKSKFPKKKNHITIDSSYLSPTIYLKSAL